MTTPFLIELGKIDASKIVFGNITTKNITDPKTKRSKFKLTTCKIGYKVSGDNTTDMIFITPRLRTSGIMKNWPLQLNEDERNDAKVSGFQMCVNITTQDTMDEPSKEEQLYLDQLDVIRNTAYNYIKKPENMKYLTKSCPGPVVYLQNGIEGFKSPYSLPKDKERDDGSVFRVPHQQYIKLIAYKKNARRGIQFSSPLDTWTFISRFRGPGNREVSPLKYVGISGSVVLAIKLEKIYFGSHQNNPIGASLQFRVYECNFTPRQREIISSLLPANEDPAEMDIPDDQFRNNLSLKEDGCEENDKHEEKEDDPENDNEPEPVRKNPVRRRRIVKRVDKE